VCDSGVDPRRIGARRIEKLHVAQTDIVSHSGSGIGCGNGAPLA
jgi:hypothetical protein